MSAAEELVIVSTIPAGLALGIGSLGSMPQRWQRKPILSIRRNGNDIDGLEKSLTERNGGFMPSDFVLSSIQSINKPASSAGNQATATRGTRVGNDSGQRFTLKQVFMSFAINITMYSETRDSCWDWVAQILMNPFIQGQISLDGLSLPVTVTIGTDFSWTDPTTTSDSADFLSRRYSVAGSATINVNAAIVERGTLAKAWQIEAGPLDSEANLVKIFTNADWKGI